MEIPPPPLVGRPDRFNAPSGPRIGEAAIDASTNGDSTFLPLPPPLPPLPLSSTNSSSVFAISLVPQSPQSPLPLQYPDNAGKSSDNKETDDPNVKALFCMMIQMQNIMKVCDSKSTF